MLRNDTTILEIFELLLIHLKYLSIKLNCLPTGTNLKIEDNIIFTDLKLMTNDRPNKPTHIVIKQIHSILLYIINYLLIHTNV